MRCWVLPVVPVRGALLRERGDALTTFVGPKAAREGLELGPVVTAVSRRAQQPLQLTLGVRARRVERGGELGDPGVVLGLDTPRAELPPFDGPPEPAAGHRHEWGALVATAPDEAPDPPATRD